MLAGVRIEAGLGQTQALEGPAFDDMRLDDFCNVGLGNVAIPDRIGIDDDVRSVLALIETPGLVSAHSPFQTSFGKLLFEKFLQPRFGFGIAASSGMTDRTLVSANKNVPFEFCHQTFAIRLR